MKLRIKCGGQGHKMETNFYFSFHFIKKLKEREKEKKVEISK